ncbi:MAG: hypothetical protein ABH814_03195 [bacterium]
MAGQNNWKGQAEAAEKVFGGLISRMEQLAKYSNGKIALRWIAIRELADSGQRYAKDGNWLAAAKDLWAAVQAANKLEYAVLRGNAAKLLKQIFELDQNFASSEVDEAEDQFLDRERKLHERCAAGQRLCYLLRKALREAKQAEWEARQATHQPRKVFDTPKTPKPGLTPTQIAERKRAKADRDREIRDQMKGAGGGSSQKYGGGSSRKALQKQRKRG